MSATAAVSTRAPTLPPLADLDLPDSLIGDLRSDLAGEAGAVMIYRALLGLSRDPIVLEFARDHLTTEERHLAFFDSWLPPDARTRLLPVWRAFGWLTGAAAALGGRRWTFATIETVESFVVAHYSAQISELRKEPRWHLLADRLATFSEEEGDHRRDADDRESALASSRGFVLRLWLLAVDAGSRAAVAAARRL